ncbi:AMP-binding protein [Nitratireductor sp. XY-223]|uniref:AMP-binding protein n=1 Tax=Nitratireductor sp. XY-223 TaxID=2561926 RepID=UPI0010AAEA94|nr:AMP-binding protein [Nitratireductor sp. XY-223]
MGADYNLSLPFFNAASKHPGRPVLYTDKGHWTYGELAKTAKRLAGRLAQEDGSGRVGILGTHSFEAYAGILATLCAGKTYVPLNLKWPEARIAELLRLLDLEALIVDANGAALLSEAVLAAAPPTIVVADAALSDYPELGDRAASFSAIDAIFLDRPVQRGPDDTAYILYTSGTTGMPKGVVIHNLGVSTYLAETRKWTRYSTEDRIAESCDITFDLTVHNMFLCWEAGASLHVLSPLDMMAPARFIRRNGITAWMSVPTLIGMMRRTGSLKPGIFPSLRISIFCGEPLPLSAARAWAEASPNGSVENIYGPTEGTVVCMRQTLTEPPAVTEERGILAIGTAYDSFEIAIFDDRQNRLPPGEAGEIALRGAQLAKGYFNAPEQAADRFRVIDGDRWYLTGDLGRLDDEGRFHHLGRTDNQVKLKGNRVELEEVEMHLREAAGSELSAVVAWPVEDGSAQGLVAFTVETGLDEKRIQERMARHLPGYMVPASVRFTDAMPRNNNGKIDRRALVAELDREAAEASAEAAQ